MSAIRLFANFTFIRKAIPIILGLVFVALITSCTHQKATDLKRPKQIIHLKIADTQYFKPRPDIIDVKQIYQLSELQQNKFRTFFFSDPMTSFAPHRRIFRYLQKYTQNYQFQNKTLTAQQVLTTKQGNCLSLAILTTALAKNVSVKTGYQIVDSDPVYQQEGDIILASEHIQSLLYDSNSRTITHPSAERGIIVDYFPTRGTRVRRRVSESEFSALFYRNLAADAIIHKHYSSAYWLLIETFKLNPLDEHAVNMMALVHEKKGLKKNADSIYRQGIKHANHKLDLLRNYSLFLHKEHRYKDAKEIEKQLAKVNVVNPFDWINLGNTAYSQTHYRESKRYYLKAVKMAPYIHQAYLGIAKSQYQLGHFGAAKKSLILAKNNALDEKTKNYYQAKLNSLTKK